MSYERKRSGRKAFPTNNKKNSVYQQDDEEEEEADEQAYKRASGLRDRPKSPFHEKRGSEIMRILKDQGSPLVDEMKSKKPINVIFGEYQLLDIIGEGSFGHVYEAKHHRTGKIVAIKKFKNKYQNKKKAFEQREIQILKKFEERDRRSQNRGRVGNISPITPVTGHCPFILKADRIELENRRLYIVFERMDMSLT